MMELPNWERASADIAELRDCSLDPGHTAEWNKALAELSRPELLVLTHEPAVSVNHCPE